jgi:hypothetical protein
LGIHHAGADVDDLPDTGLGGEIPYRPLQESAVLPGYGPDFGQYPQDRRRRFPVDHVVVFAAEVVVIHAGRVWPACIDL